MSNTGTNDATQAHRRLILTITSLTITILLATSGWTFGVLRAQAERDTVRMETKLDRIDGLLQDLLIQQATGQTKLTHLEEAIGRNREYYEGEVAKIKLEVDSLHNRLNIFFSRNNGFD